MATALTAITTKHKSVGQKTDDQLMAAYARKESAAFDALYGRYKDVLYGYLYKHCHDEGMVGEMFQDVWLRVITSADQYHGKGRFRSWLFTLAHNRLVDFYRRNDGTPDMEEVSEDVAASEVTPERQADSERGRSRLESAIRALPIEQRQAFYLREECGLAVKEIARIQEITVEAAKSRLRYAYARLKEALRDEA